MQSLWDQQQKIVVKSRDFYTPSIDIHCNHQRRLKHKIQRNGGTGNERI